MSSITKTNSSLKSDCLQTFNTSNSNSSINSFDPNPSPLALLAQTCLSIGQDYPSTSLSSSTTTTRSSLSNSTPSMISSSFTPSKSSSTLSSTSINDQLFAYSKRSSPSNHHSTNGNKKSTTSIKTSSISTPLPFFESNTSLNYFSNLSDTNIKSSSTNATTATAITTTSLYSSLDYFNSKHFYSPTCSILGCKQCEIIGHILANTIHIQPFSCYCYSCNARFMSNDELIEHYRKNHLSSGKMNSTYQQHSNQRFHPYVKPTMIFNNNDQLPFFYPHLSLSPMTTSTQRTNNHRNNK